MVKRFQIGFLCFLFAVSFLASSGLAGAEGEAGEREEGRERLEKFRRMGMPSDYALEFELRVMPRRERGHRYEGRLWGSYNEYGPVSLVELRERSGEPAVRLLIQNGLRQEVWVWRPGEGGEAKRLADEALFESIMGTDFSAFDLQMPFIHWPEYDYEGRNRVGGRTGYAYLMHPPEAFRQTHPGEGVGAVRMFLDSQFDVMMKAEILDPALDTWKTFQVMNFRNLDGQWMAVRVDLRDEQSRNRTRFDVRGAAMDVNLAEDLFRPISLEGEMPDIASGQFQYLY